MKGDLSRVRIERRVCTHKWLHASLQKDRFLVHGRGEEISEEAAKDFKAYQ